MRKAATILVLGDPGALRDELLLRPEVDVVWASSFEDALELLAIYPVDACVLTPPFEAAPGHGRFRAASAGTPCLVHRPRFRRQGSPWPEDVETALGFLARHTGLAFARYPRVPLRLPVTAGLHGQTYELETRNLSVSGVAIADFPDAPSGTRAELCIELASGPLYVLARLTRRIRTGHAVRAGLSFTDLGEGPRARIVDEVAAALPPWRDHARLFGELEVPVPASRPIERTEADLPWELGLADTVDLACPAPRPISDTQGLGPPDPTWFSQLSEDLSASERLAAFGGDAPAWAHRVLQLRIAIARARSSETGPLPAVLLDETYRLFAGLEAEVQSAPAQVREEVSSIRASLLRDVLGRVA